MPASWQLGQYLQVYYHQTSRGRLRESFPPRIILLGAESVMFSKATLLSLALPAYAAVHESIAALPAGWTESDYSLSDGSTMEMQVAL